MPLKRSWVWLWAILTISPFTALSRSESSVILRGLDKVTGRIHDFEVLVGETVPLGPLKITVTHVDRSPEMTDPETAAFLEVRECKGGQEHLLFSSWMFASSPGVSALEHPVYDVWVVHRSKKK